MSGTPSRSRSRSRRPAPKPITNGMPTDSSVRTGIQETDFSRRNKIRPSQETTVGQSAVDASATAQRPLATPPQDLGTRPAVPVAGPAPASSPQAPIPAKTPVATSPASERRQADAALLATIEEDEMSVFGRTPAQNQRAISSSTAQQPTKVPSSGAQKPSTPQPAALGGGAGKPAVPTSTNPAASSTPSGGQQPKGQGVDTASSLTSKSVRASSVTPQAAVVVPQSQPAAAAVPQEEKESRGRGSSKKLKGQSESNPAAAAPTASATTVTAAPPPTSSSNSGLRALGATPPASSTPSGGQQPKGQGVDTASSLTFKSVRASSVTPQAAVVVPKSQPAAAAVSQEEKAWWGKRLWQKFTGQSDPNPPQATPPKTNQVAPISAPSQGAAAPVSGVPKPVAGASKSVSGALPVAAPQAQGLASASHRQPQPRQHQHQQASRSIQGRHEQPGAETEVKMVTDPPLFRREDSDSSLSRSSRSASRRRGNSFDSDPGPHPPLYLDVDLPEVSRVEKPERLSFSSDGESSMPPPMRPPASAAVFTPVVDPSYADFLQKLKDAMKTINFQQGEIWTQTADPSSRKTINNSWTNNAHHIKVSAIQDSTNGQTSLVVEPTDAKKLTNMVNFANYFKNMFDVMAHTGNKYSLVSPGVDNLLQGLANDSGADISLVREGLKVAIDDFKKEFNDCLHDSTKKAFEAQATLAPSAAASGPHGPGTGTTASASASGAAITASGAAHSGSVGGSALSQRTPPDVGGSGLAGGSFAPLGRGQIGLSGHDIL